ncbi:spore germination protein GerPE [Bacillus testis]|uniref:spore germination protein GerPE n=1 Tax=Bacillus testis TaxID=1622072 RepID=UPI00067E9C4E|nr:spore germination protein GerPE [Bacillus testis]
MLSRSSHVRQLKIVNIGLSSIMQIGDTSYIDASSQALAVQQDTSYLEDDPDQFENYSVFRYRSPLPVIFEPIHMITNNKCLRINVDLLQVVGMASCSIVHVGNVRHARTATRILNIRRLPPSYNPVEQQG